MGSNGGAGERPTIMVTNDDGIDAPGLRAMVRVLVSTNRFKVTVCAPDSEKSAVVTALLGVMLFPSSELISMEQQHLQSLEPQQIVLLWESPEHSSLRCLICVYSGTVAGAREAFFNGIPSLSLSYHWVRGASNIHDFTLAAEACLPIIYAVLAQIKNKTYPKTCFLNIDLPTNVVNHKGYKLTKQGKSFNEMGWRQVTSDAQGGKMLSTMTMETNSITSTDVEGSTASGENLLFKRAVRRAHLDDDDTDFCCLQNGYITVTALGALSDAASDCQAYLKEWLPGVAGRSFSSAL